MPAQYSTRSQCARRWRSSSVSDLGPDVSTWNPALGTRLQALRPPNRAVLDGRGARRSKLSQSRTSEKPGDGYVHCEIIHALRRPASCQQNIEAELAQYAERGRDVAVGT